MKAVVLQPTGAAVENRPALEPGPGQVLVRVHTCGISRDDLPTLTGAGFVPGRAAAGTVEKAGGTRFENLVGRRAFVLPTEPCSCCHYCRTNRGALCDDLVLLGATAEGSGTRDGGAAEYMAVRGERVLPVQSNLSDAALSCVQDFAMAIAAARKAEMLYAQEAAVIGCGAWGVALVGVLLSMGCLRVFYLDNDDRRMQTAAAMGAVCVAGDAVPENARIRTVFDTVCTVKSQRTAMGLTCEKGSVVNLARTGGEVPYVLRDLNGERSIRAVDGPEDTDYYDALNMLESSRLCADALAGAEYAPEDGAAAIESLRAGALRVRLVMA